MRRHTSIVHKVAVRLFNTAVEWPAQVYDWKRLTPTTRVSTRKCFTIRCSVAKEHTFECDATHSGHALR
jgi:hypothetical protein